MRGTWAVGVLCTLLASASGVAGQEAEAAAGGRKTCTVNASGTNATDDAPAILQAFKECGRRGKVVFKPTTYYVNAALNVTWLDDVEIDLQGTLLVCYSACCASQHYLGLFHVLR